MGEVSGATIIKLWKYGWILLAICSFVVVGNTYSAKKDGWRKNSNPAKVMTNFMKDVIKLSGNDILLVSY